MEIVWPPCHRNVMLMRYVYEQTKIRNVQICLHLYVVFDLSANESLVV